MKETFTIKEYRQKRNLDVLGMKADREGLYTVESLVDGISYFQDDNEIVITTAHGFIRMKKETAKTMAKELAGILEDYWRN